MPVKLTTAGIVLAVCLTPTRSIAQTGSIPEGVVEPILTEETLPDEQGECDLRSSIAYRAASLKPASAFRSYSYNTAATVRLTSNRLHFIGEANGSHSGRDSMFSLSPGVHYQITEDLNVAAAFPAPLRGGTGRAGIVMHMQSRLFDRRRPE